MRHTVHHPRANGKRHVDGAGGAPASWPALAAPPATRRRCARRAASPSSREEIPMRNQEIAEELSSLVHLDLDAVLAYDRAIEAMGDGLFANELAKFKLDHQRHVLELSKALLDMNVKPPAAKADMKGTILGGVTGVRARLGTEQALKAMVPNEELTTSTYARALAKPFPGDVLELVRRNYDDEQRHLAWIERAIDQRMWEGDRDSTYGAGI
jgi:hypothetical protein